MNQTSYATIESNKLRETPCPHCGLRNLVNNPFEFLKESPIKCLSCNRSFNTKG